MSAAGAVLLAVAAFLPWYRVGLAPGAVPDAHQLAHPLLAHRDLRYTSILLLALAGLAMLDALLPLARRGAPVPGGAGGSVALLGAVALVCVLYHIAEPPAAGGPTLALTLSVGPWLALAGAVTMILGGTWPPLVIFGPPSSAARARPRGV